MRDPGKYLKQPSLTKVVNKDNQLGTGFAIYGLIIHMAKDFKDISPRISTLTIKD